MAFDINNNLLEVDDGGISRLVTPNVMPNAAGTTGRQWQSLTPGTAAPTAAFNQSLRISEFYSVAVDTGLGGGPRLIGGAQDNGTSFQLLANADDWTTLTGGDGTIVQVDNSGAAPVLYWSNEFLGGFTQWRDTNRNGTVDAGEQVTLQVNDAASGNALAAQDGGLPFVTPYLLHSQAPQRMLIGGAGLWEITNVNANAPAGGTRVVNAGAIVAPPAVVTNATPRFTAFAYGGVNPATAAVNPGAANPDVVYAARGNQLFIRSAPGVIPAAGANAIPVAGSVVAIGLDPSDWTTAYVVIDRGGTNLDRVYRVTPKATGGLTWQNITGNLPDTHLDTIQVLRVGADTIVLVGGRTGVNRAINPTNNNAIWAEFGSGLANSPVSDLDNATPGLYAATLGRAAWNIPAAAVAANLNQAGVLRLTGTNAGDRWLLSRDPNQPWLLNVTENLIFTQSFQLSTIQRIEVSGLGGDDTLEINVDNGPINVREKIHFDGGDNADGSNGNDTLKLVGTKKPSENKFSAGSHVSLIKARDPFGNPRSTTA